MLVNVALGRMQTNATRIDCFTEDGKMVEWYWHEESQSSAKE